MTLLLTLMEQLMTECNMTRQCKYTLYLIKSVEAFIHNYNDLIKKVDRALSLEIQMYH